MNSIVSRNSIWFYAGDIPYVDFKYKDIQFFFNFKSSLTYCTPRDMEATYPYGNAKEHGIDLHIPAWSWWLIADDTIELSCTSRGRHGILLSFYDKTKGVQIESSLTEEEAIALKSFADEMIDKAKLNEIESFTINTTTLKPSNSSLSYSVIAHRWTAAKEYTTSEC